MLMTPQQIIDALQQTSNQIEKQLVREIISALRLAMDESEALRSVLVLHQKLQSDIKGKILFTREEVGFVEQSLAECLQVIADIREAACLPDCPATDIPGHIEEIIGNLASQNVWLMSRLPESETK